MKQINFKSKLYYRRNLDKFLIDMNAVDFTILPIHEFNRRYNITNNCYKLFLHTAQFFSGNLRMTFEDIFNNKI